MNTGPDSAALANTEEHKHTQASPILTSVEQYISLAVLTQSSSYSHKQCHPLSHIGEHMLPQAVPMPCGMLHLNLSVGCFHPKIAKYFSVVGKWYYHPQRKKLRTEKLSDLLNVTQEISGRSRHRSYVFRFPVACSMICTKLQPNLLSSEGS